jgi:hypothetical protein
LLISCEKNNDSDEVKQTSIRPKTPDEILIDINTDNKIDFVISYAELATTDVPSSGGSIIGTINPIDDNQILYRFPDGNLFIEMNDTIRKNDNPNSVWGNTQADIISIDRYNFTIWETNWTINSKLESDYYLGFKLNTEGSEEIGWMHLNLNTKTGEVTLIDKEISTMEELIIQN